MEAIRIDAFGRRSEIVIVRRGPEDVFYGGNVEDDTSLLRAARHLKKQIANKTRTHFSHSGVTAFSDITDTVLERYHELWDAVRRQLYWQRNRETVCVVRYLAHDVGDHLPVDLPNVLVAMYFDDDNEVHYRLKHT